MRLDTIPLNLLLREKKNSMSLCTLHIDNDKSSFIQFYDVSKERSEGFTSILFDYKDDGTINTEGRRRIIQILTELSEMNAADQKWEVVQGIEHEEIRELLANFQNI